MPDQDPYADAAPAASPTESAPPEPETSPEKEEPGDAQTAEIPKNALGGESPKPGDKCLFEIVQVNEDSVLVKYAHDEKESAPTEAPPPKGGPMTGLME